MAQMLAVPLMPYGSAWQSLSRPGHAGQLAMCMPGPLPERSGTDGAIQKRLVSSKGGTACLGPHLSSLSCGLLAIQHAGKVAHRDL